VRGWVYYDKYKMHAELGDAWINVSPGENMLFIADPNVANDIFSRRNDFIKPLRLYSEFSICQACEVSQLTTRWLMIACTTAEMLELFGPNVDTVCLLSAVCKTPLKRLQ